jgi:hypothetical protein
MTLFRHARLANMRRAFVGRTTSAPPLVAIISTSSSRSAPGTPRIISFRLCDLCDFRVRLLTSDVKDSVSADRLSRQLDPLTDAGILVDLDVETIQPQHVQVLHRRDLIC